MKSFTDTKYIIYISPVVMPPNNAAGKRIYGNALAIDNDKYPLLLISGMSDVQTEINRADIGENIFIVKIPERNPNPQNIYFKVKDYLMLGSKIIEWLDNQKIKPHTVILYSGYAPYLLRFLPWCKKNNIKLAFDVVEWYSAENFLLFLISPYLWMIEYSMRVLLQRVDKLIVISKQLEKYYKNKGVLTIRVPPLVDHSNTVAVKQSNWGGVIKLVFAGKPEKKDHLTKIILSVIKLNSSNICFTLDIAGIDSNYINKILKLNHYQKKIFMRCVYIHGSLSQSAAIALVSNSHFSVILRPINRATTNGFSTKFVESLSVGTPVIANITGDMGNYLIDGVSGLICSNPDVECLCATLIRAKNLNSDYYNSMRENSREISERHFDPKVYSHQLSNFLGD